MTWLRLLTAITAATVTPSDRQDAPEFVQQKLYPGTWCIYDPLDGDDGFCLIGDNPRRTGEECAEHFEMT